MGKVVAINGSPRMEKGATEMILAPFLRGMTDAGAEVETVYASRLKIKPCDCGETRCWVKHPGECRHKDDMRDLYPKLRDADLLVLATPVYAPLPGDMQNFINRLLPLLEPCVQMREGRTRARFREGVRIRRFVLVSTGGWWEKENFDVVVHIVKELAANASVEFGGAVLRPHVSEMTREGVLTEEGKAVLRAVESAGRELIEKGAMNPETLARVSRPLVSEEECARSFNELQ